MKNQYLNLLHTVWKFAEGKRIKLSLIYLMFVIANSIRMLEPYLLGLFLNTIQNGGSDIFKKSLIILGMFLFVNFSFWALHGPARVMERDMSFYISRGFLEKMFQTITQIPLKWHKDHHSGYTIDKVQKAFHALARFTSDSYIYIQIFIPFAISLVAIIVITGLYGFLTILLSGIIFVVIIIFDKYLIKKIREMNRCDHKAAAVFFDYVSNISTVITLRLEKLAKKEYVKKMLKAYPSYKNYTFFNELKWFIVSIAVRIAQFAIIILYLYKNLSTEAVIMIGSLMMLFQYVEKFTMTFFDFASRYERFVTESTHLMTVDSITKAHDKLFKKRKINQLKNWKNIQIKNLSFKYEDEEHYVHTLKNINLNLQKGQKIALVGESGSGKTTLMTLIRSLNDPDKVNLKIDDKKFNHLRHLSGITTLIPQEPEIFENTIEYNVTIGITHKKTDIEAALEIACFDKVVKKLPNGIKTNIREKGVNLSGGEKQRLALARGVFAAKNSSLILLDEPTSSVDSTNELKIYKNLFKQFKDRCFISSIHKLHLLPLFDYVYVIDKGKIVEEGSFDELLKKNGVLKKQWENYENGVKS